MAESRPNLLIFMPDQLRADALGCFGNQLAHTPNIDALAARGAVHPGVREPSRVQPVARESDDRLVSAHPRPPDIHASDPARRAEPAALSQRGGYHVAFAGHRGDMFAPGVTAEQWAEIAHIYHAMVSRVDDQLGRILGAVDGNGATASTNVFFFTDHGEYLGDFGLVEKWPSGLDPCLTRIR